jgi:hypothetical protein
MEQGPGSGQTERAPRGAKDALTNLYLNVVVLFFEITFAIFVDRILFFL